MQTDTGKQKHGIRWFGFFIRALQLFFFSLSILAFISAIVMPYLEGRTNDIWAVPPLLPADLVPDAALFLSTAVLFCCWIVSLITKRNTQATTSMFMASCFLFAGWIPIFYFHQYLFLSGLRDYAGNVLTTEEWRTISRFAQTNMKPGDRLGGPLKIDYDEKLWSNFTNHTQIQKLGLYVWISVPVAGSTEIEWGGALVGHRGVMVYSNTNERPPPDDVWAGPWFVAPDIAAFIERH